MTLHPEINLDRALRQTNGLSASLIRKFTNSTRTPMAQVWVELPKHLQTSIGIVTTSMERAIVNMQGAGTSESGRFIMVENIPVEAENETQTKMIIDIADLSPGDELALVDRKEKIIYKSFNRSTGQILASYPFYSYYSGNRFWGLDGSVKASRWSLFRNRLADIDTSKLKMIEVPV